MLTFKKSFASHPRAKFLSSKNESELNARNLGLSSNKKVYFKCDECSHTFLARIANVVRGSWCPYCHNRLCDQENCKTCLVKSLFKNYPNLFEDNDFTKIRWDEEKNKINPKQLLPFSSKKAFFICQEKFECGCIHSFESKISDLVNTVFKRNNNGCPFCVVWGKTKLFCIHNSLKGKFPEIAAEWDQEKNKPILPSEILPNCNDIFHWKCKGCPNCGQQHTFPSSPNTRVSCQTSCPFCTKGTESICTCSSVAQLYPHLLNEWDYERNDKHITLYILPKASKKKFHWKCVVNNNHTWQANLSNRTFHESGCPHCYREALVDLETKRKKIQQDLDIIVYRIIPNNDSKHLQVWGDCLRCHDIFNKTLRNLYLHGGPYCQDCTNTRKLGKIKMTNLERFGCEYTFSNPEIREKGRISMLDKYNVENYIQSKEGKNRHKNTVLSKYGVENISQSEQVKEKKRMTCQDNWGVNHQMQNAEFFNAFHGFKLKEYIFPSGKSIMVQGYEPFAIDLLLREHNVDEADIVTERSRVPEIWYSDFKGSDHRYYVDIYIPSQNKMIEVKSLWTYSQGKNVIFRKASAAKSLGFQIEIWVLSPVGKILFVQ